MAAVGEDERIAHLREMVQQAVTLRDNTRRLINELCECLHQAVSTADDRRLARSERRRKLIANLIGEGHYDHAR